MQESDIHSAIRHYSALRFAMLTVFVAITAGLLHAKYAQDMDIPDRAFDLCFVMLPGINIIGIWVALAFLVFEAALNCYLAGLWSQLPPEADTPFYRRGLVTWSVRGAALSLPLGTIVVWLLAV